MLISEYASRLESLLDLSKFQDFSNNGMQIGGEDRELKRAAFAVDASLDSIEKSALEKADILVVHHGLFWGEPIMITGSHYRRVKAAIDSGLFLFAAHLPLDAHPFLGNNAQIALRLGMKSFDPFANFRGNWIGFKGRLPFPMTLEEVGSLLGYSPVLSIALKNHDRKIESVAIVSGSGGSDLEEAIREGVDLFITGEFHHDKFHIAKEGKIDVLAFGHYQSETFGVKALQRWSEKELNIDTVFIDSETGL